MSTAVSQQISLFRFQVESRRLDEGTLRILESVLAWDDYKSLDGVVCTLKQFMRHESLRIIEEIAGKAAEHKLLIVDFLVRLFALIGDNESCLALRYEALLMREQKAISDQRLLVSYREWLAFAEHSLESGFCSIAKKACEKALLCFDMNIVDDPENYFVIEKIKKLKDVAVISASSKSGAGSNVLQEQKYSAELTRILHSCGS
ncbi:protein DOUBLE-STRAND BREAK FORMATION isoform X3 [Solanum verrucosum]|uniref:protein DOUBLE-STRAND BREAK FORMATION isoform X3 n=1 Tax=Solanum verrucosum TaxID=315347 RepID=UPI0020D12BE9|nr:protein DOUBLE-STRAND BREAK FORMATION isoform X3 [Solanum verrucosum]